jgi:putative hemolysin
VRRASARSAMRLILPVIVWLAAGTAMADDRVLLGTFVGRLPCADCSGIEEQLTLYQDDAATTAGSYVLKDTYLGRNVTPHVAKGAWRLVRGSAKDPDARVFRLDPAGSGQPQYYLAAGIDALKPLDSERKEISAPVDMTLRRQVAGLANPASVNCTQQGGTLELRTDAKGGTYGVCRFADGRQCEEWALFRNKKCVLPAE